MIGFITEDGYAAVPFGKQLMIIYNAPQTVTPDPKKSTRSARVTKSKN